MKTPIDEMLSQLHILRLKPQGFRKSRHTFSRDQREYWERFNFQGSSWNSTSDGKWLFYVNVGVEFKDLPPEPYPSFCANTHWADRIEQTGQNAPSVWSVDLRSDRVALMDQIVSQVEASSNNIALNIVGIREFVLQEKTEYRYSFSNMKTLWQK